MSDVDSYSEFLPFCTESKVTGSAPKEEEPNAGATKRVHAELGVGFKSFRERYTSLVEMKEGEWVAVSIYMTGD